MLYWELKDLMDNFKFDVFEKIEKVDWQSWHLYVDALYKVDLTKVNISAEVLSKLLGLKNQGGFRYRGKTESPLFSDSIFRWRMWNS